jgi:hypothetical protein
MRLHHIIFIAVCSTFLVYLIYREIVHYLFHRNMKIGDRCSFYIEQYRTSGMIRHIEEKTGQIVVLDNEMKGYVLSRGDIYPPFHPIFHLV